MTNLETIKEDPEGYLEALSSLQQKIISDEIPIKSLQNYIRMPKEFHEDLMGIKLSANKEKPQYKDIKLKALMFDLHSHLIPELEVDYSVDYKKLISEAGLKSEPVPSYRNKEKDPLSISSKYPTDTTGKIIENVVLVRYLGNLKSYSKYREWGIKNKLRLSTPHVLFAIAKNLEKLNLEVIGSRYVIETTSCVIDNDTIFCSVLLDKNNFKADIGSPGDTVTYCGWIAFLL